MGANKVAGGLKRKLDDSFVRTRKGDATGGEVLATRLAAGVPIALGTSVAGLLWVEFHELWALEEASRDYFFGLVVWIVTSVPVVLRSVTGWLSTQVRTL